MKVNVIVEDGDDPQSVEQVARDISDLYDESHIDVDVHYPSSRVIKF